MNKPPLAVVQALLFAAPRPLHVSELADLLESSVTDVKDSLDLLKNKLAADNDSGLQVEQVANGYRLATKANMGDYVSRVTEVVKTGSLSNAALESLAIIAYRQPITRVEIEAIRGVRSDSAVNALIERGLIEEQGRKDAPGRPVLFVTTADFLLHFGLDSLSQLPPLPPESEETVPLPLAYPS